MDYQFIILPVIAGLIAQISKLITSPKRGRFSIRSLIAYSGMPSGHSAVMVAITTIIGFKLGLADPLFAISLILTLLIIRDAVGLRKYIGKHGEVINDLVEDLEEDKYLDEKYPRLLEHIGHTFKQVLVGAIIGFVVSYGGWLLMN
ncbi:MAG: divergent PAP2 family protein [bacterium]